MKQGWEIKKLGEVATYINGFAFKPEQWTDNGIPIIRIQNLNNPSAPYNYCDFEVPPKYLVEQGDILISWSASLGVYEWNNDNGYLNQHIFKVVFDKGNINKYYFKYAVASKLNIMLENLHGATMKHIVKKDFDNTLIPVPPLPEQEKIVSELDCLSGIIEKKRQQLKELDALAQSIFYEMFGNPVDNERGWEVKKLGDSCTFQQGIQVPIEEQFEEQEDGMVRFLRIVDFTQGNEKPRYIHTNSEKHILKNEEIAIVRYGTPGFVCYGKYGAIANNLFKIMPLKNDISFMFLVYWLKSEAFQSVVVGNQYGAALQAIKFSTIRDIPIFLPPLPLQQSFAQKIEAIEQQKALIKQSIAEVETLFNARMQEYFE